jgi:hypothetical protein
MSPKKQRRFSAWAAASVQEQPPEQTRQHLYRQEEARAA